MATCLLFSLFITSYQNAGSPTISANNLQSQKTAPPGYYCQSIGHDIIDNAARCELKHKISTKVTGLDFVIKSLYTADFTLMKYTRQAIDRLRETALPCPLSLLRFCVQNYM